MSLCLHCETRIVISSGCVLDVGVRVNVCVTVYTLDRHFFPTFLNHEKMLEAHFLDSSMSLRLHCETRIVISSGCVLDVGVRVYVCVTVYTLGRHFIPTILTVAES